MVGWWIKGIRVTDEPNKLADETEADVVEETAAADAAPESLAEESATVDAPSAPIDQAESESAEELAAEPVVEQVAEESAPVADEPAEAEVPEASADEDVEAEADTEATVEAEAEVEEPEAAAEEVAAPPAEPEPEEEIQMDWYILKVQSNRERSISDALERKIAIEGLGKYFGQVIVPTEKVTEFKGGKKKVVERKLYPGYIVVQMHINDDTWFAVRETSGVGDFTGAGGKPTPMLPHEVSRIIQTEEEETDEAPKLDIKFSAGDKVKVREGNFESFEGEVSSIDEASGRVTVMINIFGRSTPVELEYWQIEAV